MAALLFCRVPRVRHTIVQGRVLVRDGELQTVETVDLPRLVQRHKHLSATLLGR